ncbi:MAG: cation diffusion facilitator family transporter [Treponemataceae bacterium]|nr:cation diffusion facilitator family transporter [Treponemataceae bacterium]
MISLLARIFIPNRGDVHNPDVRARYGVLCGAAGIALNLLLFAGKLAAGLLAKSISISADAFNNLSDAAGSAVTLVGFKMAGKKPDAQHPFGHGRIEYIAGLIVSFLILVVGWELLTDSVRAVISPKPVDASLLSVIVLAASIAVKFYMYFYNHRIGRLISSEAMEAAAKDSRNDTVSTAAVLAAALAALFFPETAVPLDGIAGIVVALFILRSGVQSVRDTSNPLLGVPASPEFVKKVEAVVLAHAPISGIHDLIVHDYGPGRMMVSLHAEVPGDRNIFELHEAIDNAEGDIARTFGCSATIHMDPVDVRNKEVSILKTRIAAGAQAISPELAVHDVRIVPGNGHTNVIFDAVRPYSCPLSPEELTEALAKIVSDYNPSYRSVIHIDNPFA